MTCFTLHTLRIFNILYWSLPNNLYGSLTFFTPVDRAPLWNVLRYKNASLRCFFCRRLRYQCFTHLFNQTVEREDDHRLLAELLAVAWPSIKDVYQRFSTLGTRFSRFSRHFYLTSSWRCENVEISTIVDRSFDHFSLFELCLGWEKSSLQSFRILACRCDPSCPWRRQYGGPIQITTSGKQWLQQFVVLHDYV